MSALQEIEELVRPLLAGEPYNLNPDQHESTLLAVLKDELSYACERSLPFRNYVERWPVDYRSTKRVADLPFLPVGVFKTDPPLALVERGEITRTLASSATTGQVPSRVVLDAATSKRMTIGVMAIIRHFIGSARRPYLVIDTPAMLAGRGELGARSAAIQGLRAFGTEVVCCLSSDSSGDLELEVEKLLQCAARWKDTEVLVYGFTYVIWNHLVKPLESRGITLNLPNVRILHSGGWKRLQQQAVNKEAFAHGVASVFNCADNHVIDFYGMVENVGVVYPDCEQGNKHVPAFAGVIVRDPLTLEPVAAGQRGLLQVCSVLPTSFPGFLVLTEDIAEVICQDGCPCVRRGTAFRFVNRVPKAEVRGCGNVETLRTRPQNNLPIA
jgi:phenylacetate-coenzyme A ligase PaaK-like adenylate-forming protein